MGEGRLKGGGVQKRLQNRSLAVGTQVRSKIWWLQNGWYSVDGRLKGAHGDG